MKKKLSSYLGDYYEFSKAASDATRAAAYAGIGLIWVFRIDAHPAATLPRPLLGPLTCFAVAVALDVLQYVTGTIVWRLFTMIHERRAHAADDSEINHSIWLPRLIELFFWGKILTVLFGYVLVAAYLHHLWWS